MELDSKTSLKLGDAGIPELTDEDIASLRSGTKITKDYSYPNTNNDVVGQFEFEFVPDATGMNGDHLADVTGNKVETYTLSIKFVAKTLEERTAILNQAGKTIVPPQTDSKEINDSKLNKINVPKGGNIVTDTSVTGNYIVNVFAIYKQSTSTNPDTKEHPKLAGAKFSLTGKKHKNVYYGLSDNDGLVRWYSDKDCKKSLLFSDWQTDTYTFEEIQAPVGYSLNTNTWTIKKEVADPTVISKVVITKADESLNQNYYFNNTPLYDLPSTGGSGIYLYMIGGMLLMFAAVWILYKNKCKEVLEK